MSENEALLRDEIAVGAAKDDHAFITEILEDLSMNGYVEGGKAYDMLNDWKRELATRAGLPTYFNTYSGEAYGSPQT